MKRRAFLKNTLTSMSMVALSPGVMLNNHAMASLGDNKALVCIFLAGGNDSHNMFVPAKESLYTQYKAAKGKIALNLEEMVHTGLSGDLDLMMHPALTPLKDLFLGKNGTVILNSGNLIQPGSKSDFELGVVPSIPRRGSHSDMQHAKRRGQVDGELTTGWGGRLMVALNEQVNGLPPSYNIQGTSNFLVGTQFQPAIITNKSGLKEFESRPTVEDAVKQDIAATRFDLFRQQINVIKGEMLSVDEGMKTILETPITNDFGTSSIGEDLELVAKVIKNNASLAVNEQQSRQIFYVTLGGFDTHKNQLASQTKLYEQLAEAIVAFQAEMNNSPNVTTFTMSDFGRTLLSNGEGTGHGWAGHELIIGGAVDGGRYFGNIEDLNHLGEFSIDERGRMIPSISSDQVGATLATWFGIEDYALDAVFPNLVNFEERNLGFMI
ncbi:DUF1501 domain-containing protein [Vibrio sp. ZSDE26]|uniref:DUF1501 domain-containing protein n=1 Tax=Vibrio amylolyticus TaxID=2847292 RepID=A0A9X2BHY3_9VIBR|nr:DUF1501 domain-containing protein [Vibrio amylolyticus]MCK6264409.1 DUF1501 domain-containing protein [Vibrio amylolyticus]